MKLTWYGHSCFKLDCEDGSIVFDPYKKDSVPGLILPELQANLVLCSHEHDDHSGKECVEIVGDSTKLNVEKISTFHDNQQGKLRGRNIVHIVNTEGMRIVHLGDIGCMFDISTIEYCDVLMIPVGGYYTIDARQALDLIGRIQPRIVIPMHYRTDAFGYDVISTIDKFISNVENCIEYDTNEIDVQKETPSHIAILRCK